MPPRKKRLALEILEDRTLLTAISWVGEGDGTSWSDKKNWSTDTVPGPSDDVTINVSGDPTILYQGGEPSVNSLLNDDTIWVNGSSAKGDAILTVSDGITNNGTIQLKSSNGGYRSDIATGSSTLTNAGTISALVGSGGQRQISGTLDNQGQINVDGNTYLDIAGTYDADGGSITGPGYLYDCALYVLASPSGGTTILIEGNGDTLETDNLAGTTLWVQGNYYYINQNATLNIPSGLTNDGTILLESQTNGYTDTLSLAGTFTNDSDGTIQVTAGSGGGRTITGTLVNEGQIDVDTASYLYITGTYDADGGSITGPGYLYDCALYVLASPSGGTTILIEGSGDTLETDNLAGTTLWVQGNYYYINQNATLNIPSGLTNDGTILLESQTNGYTDTLSLAGTFTNDSDGTIQVTAGSGGGRTITGTLVNEGQIDVDTASYLYITGTYDADGGSITGPGYLYDCALYVLASPSGGTTILIEGNGDTLETDNLAGTTLWVQGNYYYINQNATLNIPSGLTNDGTILLESQTNGYTDTLSLAGTFTNDSDGTIHVVHGSGGGRTITGTLVDQGQINVDGNTYMYITGTYDADGGSITGPGYLYDCALYVLASPSGGTTILIEGNGDTLETDNLAGTTLWVQGNYYYINQNATLNIPSGLTNDGTILLESQTNGYTDTLSLAGTFTNDSDGTIQVTAGSGGGRTITGTLVNEGQIDVDTASYLYITGTYDADGGSITGPGYLYDCALYVLASPSGGTTILIEGSGDTLETDNLAGTTLWVQGNYYYINQNATLNIPSGLTNDGTILLESQTNGYTDTLSLAGTFTNDSDGTIQVTAGSGGGRTITGTLVNEGQIDVDTASYLYITGTYDADGGSITGPGYLYDCALYVLASPSGGTTILIEGNGDTLETDNLAGTTLWVQGNYYYINQNATLNIPSGLTNDGTILLESQTNGYTDTLSLAGTFTNDSDGTIQVTAGSGGGRTITGTLVNEGQIDVDTASYLYITGTYDADGGSITGPGYLYDCALYVLASPSGGTTILIEGSGDTLETDNLAGTTLWVQGNYYYINQNATLNIPSGLTNDGTILLESQTNGYTDTLSLAGTFTNDSDGTIQVSAGSGGSRVISGQIINAEGTINLDASTTFGISSANLVNSGLISIAGATVTVVGKSFNNEVGGLISGYGTFNKSGVSFTNNGILDLSPPSILAVQMAPTTVAITYYDTNGMNVSTVTNIANYTLLGSGGDGIFGNGNDINESSLISNVVYTPSTETATLELSSDLPDDFYRVMVNGSNVVDAANVPLLAGTTDQVNRIEGVVPATTVVSLDPGSDSGEFDNDGLTNVTDPTFDIQVNQAGTIGIDFEGNGQFTSTLAVQFPGTYQLTAPTLTDGTYSADVTFTTSDSGIAQSSTTYTIDTVGPYVSSMSPDAAVGSSVSEATVTFSEPVNLNTFIPSAITLTGPGGVIAVDQPQLVSGSTYEIGFASQTVQGTYSLTIAPTVEDIAGNEMDQNQNGINGESDDSFTGTFTIALPDLAVTATQSPSSTDLGVSIPVSWTVTNISPTNPAPSTWTDAVYVSPDSVLDGNAVQLISVGEPVQPPLEPLASYTQDESITIPTNVATGSEYLLFQTNANGGQLESDSGDDTNDLVAVPITLLPAAQASVSLDPASDSGAPDYPGYTNVTTPTFDVQVNQAGSITVDFDGNPSDDQTLAVTAAGTYQFTAPTLANGAYVTTATFDADGGGIVQTTTDYTINTLGAYVTAMSPTGTIGISASGVMVTFDEPVDLNSFSPSAITFTGPGGPITVDQPQLVSGTTYNIPFATQAASGDYTLTIAPSVTDFAGNELDQNQNGINGEPTDSFTGTFTENLPIGGPITLNTPTLGFVPPNYVDDWTFFGRAGQTITSVVTTTDEGNPPPPALDFAVITLEDSSGDVLGTASNTDSGLDAILANITLPADGVYNVLVQAPADPAGAIGFYDLTVADATVHQMPLTVNTPVTGQLEDQYSADQWVFSTTANQQVQFDLLAAANPNIEFDLTGPDGYTAFSGATTSSGPIDLPTTGTYTLTVHTSGAPGGYGFELEQASQIDLTLNTPDQVPLAGNVQSQLFDVTLGASNPLEINLTDANSQDQNEIYVSYGMPPTRNDYQYRFTGGAAANHTVVLTGMPGTYYVLVYNNLVKSAGSYTIEADSAPFLLSGMTPNTVGNGGNITLQFSGVFPLGTGNGGYVLTTAPTVQFIASDGTLYPATPLALVPPPFGTVGGQSGGVNPDGTMTVSAVVPGGALLAGTYSVEITDNSGYSQTLTNALTVVQGGLGILKTNVIVPNPIGYHVASTIYVQYSNVGNAPLEAPILVLSATQNGVEGALMTLNESLVVSGFWTSATPDGYSQSVEFLASGSVPGILQPGESETVPVYYAGWLRNQWDFSRPPIDFTLGVLDTTNTQTIDWPSLQSSLQPANISQAAWNALYPSLTSQLGSTWGDYVQSLDAAAQYLAGLGENVTDIGQLFSFEVQQANGYSPLSSLASATDAQVDVPGLPLSFSRSFDPGIIARNQFGSFGWGWSDSWDTSLTVDSDGSVNVLGPDGSLQRFQPDSRGGYFDQAGDYGTLAALPDGGYTLTELSGQVTAYNPDGSLNYIQDDNGNRITASYTDGLLTQLTDSSGQFLMLTYNAGGLISTITDSAGRTTTYDYDPTDQYLTSVVDFNGQTTAYTYDTGTNPATAHALLSVTNPDGTHDYFSYDAEGRLADAQRDGGADDTTFSYSEGQVDVTDALGDTTIYSFDNNGLLVQVENPLGESVHYTYDSNFNLIQTTDAAGQTYTNTYDNFGDLLSTTDPLGHTVNYTYECNDDRLASVTDANGNTTNYAYDGNGNLTSTTYADGTIESVAYDPVGNVISSTDQMGQTTQYTYDAAGNILTETFADGTETVFTYDDHENLTSATDASGTTTLTYNADDELIQITYPSGLYLQYSYDAAGRRIQMVDQSGFTVNYTYDDLGNLSTLTDGSGNLIVQYTYDAVGRLSREDDGNGTYVIYTYDAAGELLDVVNYAPDGSVNSRYDDTFDNLGRLIARSSLDGTWTYSYDAVGDLIHAVYTSNNPDVPNQNLTYAYDAAGNRTETIINGVTTQYTTNDMNEYTQVGDTTYTYNADGNQTSASGPGGTTDYLYNDDGQLTDETGPGGSWTFQYDVFGNQVGITHGGQTTNYLFDGTGSDQLASSYDGSGNLIAHFVYGAGSGPVTQDMSGGISYYYLYCSSGNTMGLTNSAGAVVQSYVWDPFGNALYSTGDISTPLTFGSQLGFLSNGDGTFTTPTGKLDPESEDWISEATDYVSRFFATLTAETQAIRNTNPDFETPRLDRFVYPLAVANDVLSLSNYNSSEPHTDKENADHLFDISATTADVIALGAYLFVKAAEYGAEQYAEQAIVAKVLGQSEYAEAAAGIAEGLAALTEAEELVTAAAVAGGIAVIAKYDYDYWEPVLSKAYGSLSNSIDYIDLCVNSVDPNNKIGPAGYGPQDFVSSANPLPYRVDFENDPTATAPAQRVDITDQLDPNLDWSTFQWTSFGFGDTVITIPPNTQNYETTVPMTYDGVTFRVVIDLSLNPLTGMVHASFQSLNAANLMTGLANCPGTLSLGPVNPYAELPPPVTVGFLPPEDGTGRGMGFIGYTVLANPGLATGTQIRNVADVTFDLGNTIATDQVSETDPSLGVDPSKQDLITIDSVAPTSSVAALPAYQSTATFMVNWSGSDDPGGSGVGSYTIYVSDDGGPFVPWLVDTTYTSGSFLGVDGHTYGFFSIATDNAGNQEPFKSAAEATTTIDISAPTSTVAALPAFSPATFTLNWSGSNPNGLGIASYDIYESDNGGAFTALLTDTTLTSTSFTGEDGQTYGFYSVATDVGGNQQPIPTGAQATTQVDAVAPTSSVASLPATENSTSFTVNWSGQDNPGGSGIAFYDIYYSTNGGAFGPLLLGTTDTSDTFSGVDGDTYGFYSVATDNVGNVEPTPSGAEATTEVVVSAASATTVVSESPTTGYGQSVTFMVTVAPVIPGLPTPTGSVELYDGTFDLGPATLSGGVATLTTSSLDSGVDSITAVYSGDNNFATSTSPAISQTVNLGGEVFNDANGNGVLDPGDPGSVGWTVSALDGSNNIVATATTDSNGDYSLIGVGPGTYSIQELPPTGYVSTTASSVTVTTTGGPSPSVINFGEFQTDTLSGEVYNDLNGNGTLDSGEPGLSGVTVNLVVSGNVVASTTSDSNGNFAFNGVGPGAYTIEEVVPTNYVQTAPASGTYSVTTTSGTNVSGEDFGDHYLPILSPAAVLDNGQFGFSSRGEWTTNTGGYDGTYLTIAPATSATYSQWRLGVPEGKYDVWVTWVAASSDADNAPFRVSDNATVLGTVLENEKQAPFAGQYGGVYWVDLGRFTFKSGIAYVRLSANADGTLAADAVLLVSDNPPDVVIGGGGSNATGSPLLIGPASVLDSTAATPTAPKSASSVSISPKVVSIPGLSRNRLAPLRKGYSNTPGLTASQVVSLDSSQSEDTPLGSLDDILGQLAADVILNGKRKK